jgi:glutaredoxin
MRQKILIPTLFIGFLLSISYQALNAYFTSSDQQHVLIYTTQDCPYCHTLREMLEDYQVSYQDVDVENTIRGQLAYLILNQPGVPISIINEQIIYGYDGKVLTDALVDAGYTIALKWDN